MHLLASSMLRVYDCSDATRLLGEAFLTRPPQPGRSGILADALAQKQPLKTTHLGHRAIEVGIADPSHGTEIIVPAR
jgi:hypothetical protein